MTHRLAGSTTTHGTSLAGFRLVAGRASVSLKLSVLSSYISQDGREGGVLRLLVVPAQLPPVPWLCVATEPFRSVARALSQRRATRADPVAGHER